MNKILKNLSISIGSICFFSCNSTKEINLFDGKTLQGWEGSTSRFSVRDRAVVGRSLEQAYDKSSYLCTDTKYGDFELTL
ncbi:MAG: family 16 glycoside hydrolase [Flavobacteriaceae bacterium]